MNEPDQIIQTVANAARQLASPEQRRVYLDMACANDLVLRQRVEQLIENANQTDIPEQTPAGLPNSQKTVKLQFIEKRLPCEGPGDRIGRYKILERLGEGGCGIVYLAEQEEPVRRRVALKVIKLGMDTEQVIARFEAERQALALMDHQNIAKVFDAGATDQGRPFFVMELVRGVPITQYCDESKLSIAERLALVVTICHAVQHAHQKGIIHRDLKPSNILVTLHDGVAIPKVIDFGIAKATEQRLTDKTLFTELQSFLGTPAYCSPEQAEMTGLDIDTRSDIYSLGVLLYEMLTGTVPFDAERLFHSGLDEMRRIIREESSVRPSTRLNTMKFEAQKAIALKRGTNLRRLASDLRGDLDWIVMKALEKDRIRRYDTAAALAQDLDRFLQREPVNARAPSTVYLLGKLIRRHCAAFTAVSTVVVALIAGITVSGWQMVKARRAEQNAEQVANFLTEMFRGVGKEVALGGGTALLRGVLDRTAERVGQEFKKQPEVEVRLRTTLRMLYYNIGEFSKADTMAYEAINISKRLHRDKDYWTLLSLKNLAWDLRWEGKLTEAEGLYRAALAMARKLGDKRPDLIWSLNDMGSVLLAEGKFGEAETMQREVLIMRRKLLGNQHSDVAESISQLALVLDHQDKLPEAESLHREALAMRRENPRGEPSDVTDSLANLGRCLLLQHKFESAEAILRECLDTRGKLTPNPQHINEKTGADWQRFYAETLLGGALFGQEKLKEADRFLRSGYEGMAACNDKILADADGNLRNAPAVLRLLSAGSEIAANGESNLREALGRLVQSSEASGDATQAEEWKRKLEELQKSQASRKGTNATAARRTF